MMRFFLLLVTFFVCSFTQAQNQTDFSQLSIDLDARQSLPLSSDVSFDIEVSDVQGVITALRDWENITVDIIDDDFLKVSIKGQAVFTGEINAQHLANTFVIDIEEESIKKMVSGFKEENKQPAGLDELVKYVNGFISEPTYVNGFNIASVVAEQRSGDCTEYAVLSTALARSLGIPSRVVFGSVILEYAEGVTAYGHAWAEVFIDQKWQILDAALYKSKARQHFYLPVGKLDNEGPGFSLSLFALVSRLPLRIRRLKNL